MKHPIRSLNIPGKPKLLFPLYAVDCGVDQFELTHHTSKGFSTRPVSLDGVDTSISFRATLFNGGDGERVQVIEPAVQQIVPRENGLATLTTYYPDRTTIQLIDKDGIAIESQKFVANPVYDTLLKRAWEGVVEMRDLYPNPPQAAPQPGPDTATLG